MIYKDEYLKEISFPLGGIGTGCIGISGNGQLIDWEIFNRPNKGSINDYTFFCVVAEYKDGKRVVKILNGDIQNELSGRYTGTNYGFGYGVKAGTMGGYPHFQNVTFIGEFPIASLEFSDDNFPGKVIMNAWNPFIPLDSFNSSIPGAFFDISIINGLADVKYYVYFNMCNPFDNSKNKKIDNENYTAIKLYSDGKTIDDINYGDITIAFDLKNGDCQEYWYRGNIHDSISIFWRELNENNFKNRKYDTFFKKDKCIIGGEIKQNIKNKFVITWNVPNCYNYWDEYKDENGKDIIWKNYYSTIFKDSQESCFYSLDNYDDLFSKTKTFKDALFSSTYDDSIIDAVSSSLSILKSPTVMRLENGAVYGFEGTHEHMGSCEGTCTHVWSYTYALCFLFPDLERSIRETEFEYDFFPSGRLNFRTKLPLGRKEQRRPHCLDGQMMTVVKTYREWKISGDDKWLIKYWDKIKKVISYAWNEENYGKWDRNKDGILEGQMHHTLDTDLFGPSSWLEGLYILALKAGYEMATYLHDDELAKEYLTLFKNGYEFIKNNLFNGEYFIQKIDLSSDDYIKEFECPNYWHEEQKELKYQIGEGCLLDQMLAQWHSNILGLGEMYDSAQKKKALESILKYNFKKSLRNYPNLWRVYALNDESGCIICSYPDGKYKPNIPIQYLDECMTGFEYAFAGLLISEGYYNEGLDVIKAVRNRYDGKKRNPFNELECGGNYARSMACFSLLPIISGFEFDMSKKMIGFSPKVQGYFKTIFSLDSGYGIFERDDEYKISLISGCLNIKQIKINELKEVEKVLVDGSEIRFVQNENSIFIEDKKVKKELLIIEKRL